MHFSPEDLLQFLYNETTPEMTISIQAALEQDWTLREKLAVLKAAQGRLDALTEAPRTEAVLHILRYAAQPETVVPK